MDPDDRMLKIREAARLLRIIEAPYGERRAVERRADAVRCGRQSGLEIPESDSETPDPTVTAIIEATNWPLD